LLHCALLIVRPCLPKKPTFELTKNPGGHMRIPLARSGFVLASGQAASRTPCQRFFSASKLQFEAPHAVLGVKSTATQDQIRQAFLLLAKKYHPDVNPDPGAHDEFVRVQAAYLTLSKPGDRANPDTSAGGPTRPSHERPDTEEWGFEHPRDHWTTSDWYSQKRRGKGRASRREDDFDEDDFGGPEDDDGYDWQDTPHRGRKAHQVMLTLTFTEALLGCLKSVELPLGSRSQRLEVQISPGATSRDELRIGYSRSNAAVTVKLKVQGEAVFRSCGGLDIGVTIPITFSQAVLGASVPVPMLNGSTVTVQVPAGTKTGNQLILHGQGVRSLNQRAKQRAQGNLHVTFAVQVPSGEALTERQRAALREFRVDETPDHTPVKPVLGGDHRPKHRRDKPRHRSHSY